VRSRNPFKNLSYASSSRSTLFLHFFFSNVDTNFGIGNLDFFDGRGSLDVYGEGGSLVGGVDSGSPRG
jgi:hypothetical protein